MAHSIRTATADDTETVLDLLWLAFHDGNPEDEEAREPARKVFEPARSLLTFEGDQAVGHVGAFSRELTVPGATVPAAFVTMVAVASGHTRRGVASAMLTRQLRESPDPVAVLWASEGRIYQRFGYGMATRRMKIEADTREVRLNAPRADGSRVRVGPPESLRKEMIGGYEATRLQRPGFAGRNEAWWDHLLADPKSRRGGAGPLQAVIHEGPSGVDGYALFRVKSSWDGGGPKGEVSVSHLVAGNPTAYQELWRYLLGIDLTRGTTLWFGAIDEPLFDMVNEPRRLNASISDGLWLRLTDVPAALAARRYATGTDLVIEVTDDLIPANTGRYRLDGSRTDAPADVAMDVGTLGAIYLGGGSAGALAAAGRITELHEGAVARADAAFRWHRAPVGIEMF